MPVCPTLRSTSLSGGKGSSPSPAQVLLFSNFAPSRGLRDREGAFAASDRLAIRQESVALYVSDQQ